MCWPEPVRLMHVAQCRRGSAFKDSIESKDPSLINNRQAGRRNRGRNNGRPNGNDRNNGENGDRIDNRARGNAPQLLEKYRNLARDAQLAGDRVNTEYYLQFADHYFRVIADDRARQEEQQARYRRPGRLALRKKASAAIRLMMMAPSPPPRRTGIRPASRAPSVTRASPPMMPMAPSRNSSRNAHAGISASSASPARRPRTPLRPQRTARAA